MRKVFFIFVLLSVYFTAVSASPIETAKEPRSSYLKAADSLKDLNTQLAYKRLEIIIRDFPKSEEAKKAVLLRAVISATEFSSSDMLAAKYSEAIQKAKSNDVKKEIIKLYMETSKDMIDSGTNLIDDVRALLEDRNKSMTLEIKKEYDSLDFSSRAFLSIKKLEAGELPTAEEIKDIKGFYKDGASRYVLGKVLAEDDLTAKRTINKEVDWAGTMFLMGNWLIHVGGANKSGWLDPTNQKITKSLVQAEKSFLAAKQCFEKAKKLSKVGQVRTQSDERIKEINQILNEFKGGK